MPFLETSTKGWPLAKLHGVLAEFLAISVKVYSRDQLSSALAQMSAPNVNGDEGLPPADDNAKSILSQVGRSNTQLSI